jgi:tripartite-type tricarboxylate transporter receptor subunit TctC
MSASHADGPRPFMAACRKADPMHRSPVPRALLRRLLATVLCAAATLASSAASRVPSASELMDWAEQHYAALFPSRQADRLLPPYLYRHYPETGNYLGVTDGDVWLLGPAAGGPDSLLKVGHLQDFACVVFPAECTQAVYPTQRVNIIVPTAAGSATDVIARDLANVLGGELQQSFFTLNVTGERGMQALRQAAQAPADGYTLLITDQLMATAPSMFRSAAGVLEAFEFLGLVGEVPLVLTGRPGLPASDLGSLQAWLGTNPTRTIGTTGQGSASDLCASQLAAVGGLAAQKKVYTGSAPALVDLLGNVFDFYCDTLPLLGSHVQAARVRGFGLTAPQRTTLTGHGQVPTLAEQGFAVPGMTVWYGLYAPRGLPPEVSTRINGALRGLWSRRDYQRRMAARLQAVADARATPEGHRAFVAAEKARWAPFLSFVD